MIDFAGSPLAEIARRYGLKPNVTTSRSKAVNPYMIKVVGTDLWRAVFDIDGLSKKQIDLRCFLRLNDKNLTETWLHQFFPFKYCE